VVNPFQPGDQKTFHTTVTEDKLARFEAGMVHPVYSTFALGGDAEWACRLFVLEMKEAGEEGIGTLLQIEHLYPAPLGSTVTFTAQFATLEKNHLICTWEAHANGQLIARGKTGQKIINKAKFDALLEGIQVR
jgi:predicted thioesterase